MNRIRIAAAQIACRAREIEANLAAHLAAIDEAHERGVDLLVFPELSLTDYESRPDVPRLARPSDCPELRRLAQAAPGITTVVGFIERGADGRDHNSAAILDGGRVLHTHRKLNLPTYGALVEGHHYAPGQNLDVVSTRVGPLAVLICADTWNPAWPWLAALSGAEILAVPVASARGAVSSEFDSRAGWDINLRHTALSYGVPVVMANHCGRRGGLDFWGGSVVLDPHGRELARAGDGPELIVATVDPEDGRRARELLPTVRDADPDGVAAELARRLRGTDTRRVA